MGLFIVRHEHGGDRCPAGDPAMGGFLLNHLSRPTARRFGVEIKGEAVVQGDHVMYMILEADSEDDVRVFVQPFAEAGTVDVYPASTCVRAVASGGCVAAPPDTGAGAAVDPEEACAAAIDAGLLVHRAHPLNGETSIAALRGGVVMPNAHFYVRNHFAIPALDAATWHLDVTGLVERPLRLALHDLHQMPSHTVVVTLECAGNGRFLLDPPTPGEQWRDGAVSTAEWTGVPLAEILDRAGILGPAREIVFRGADSGDVDGGPSGIAFERSLAIDVARDAGAVLAYAMNGDEIPVHHGFPVRLVVPDWYGVASVKWLTAIEVVDGPFTGFYQADKYHFEYDRDGATQREPVTLQRVRSLVVEPAPGARLARGDIAIRGVAWSGAGPIDRVDVSIDDGPWQAATLVGDRHRHSWQGWELITRLERPGPLRIRSRATDLSGRAQPEQAEWNRSGYGNNSIQEVHVDVV